MLVLEYALKKVLKKLRKFLITNLNTSFQLQNNFYKFTTHTFIFKSLLFSKKTVLNVGF